MSFRLVFLVLIYVDGLKSQISDESSKMSHENCRSLPEVIFSRSSELSCANVIAGFKWTVTKCGCGQRERVWVKCPMWVKSRILWRREPLPLLKPDSAGSSAQISLILFYKDLGLYRAPRKVFKNFVKFFCKVD